MRLYLLQHGEAVAKDVDPDRPLSAKGRQDMEALAERLAAAGLKVSRLAHSGKTRARQSAETVAAAIMPAGAPEVLQGLAPKDPVAPLLADLGTWEGDTMLVGHQPFMGRLVGALLDCAPEQGPVAFQPGTLVGLERQDDGAWRLIAVLRPDL
jgi:phosphohistidine phosphatase